ncbi:MAG: translocation/assembly module TamB domain-containing protein, partial [Sphaerochaetaceae bacterium]|nr:translocation/assembly module TamB domain-containing protein [Sphaerochaetaceae bacterium]
LEDSSLDLGFSYKVALENNSLRLLNGEGYWNNLKIEDVALDISLDSGSIVLDCSATNVLHNIEYDVFQGGKLRFKSTMKDLVYEAIGLFAGLGGKVQGSVELYDAYLGDGFTIEDTYADLVFENNVLSINGNNINGSYDFNTGFINLSVDKSFLFGLDVKGKLGKSYDLQVSNLFFPLPVANQFINTVLVNIPGGNLEGNFSIIGNNKELGLYGMLYIQTLEVSSFFLPDQLLIANNLVITLHGDTISVPKTSMYGRKGDGTYYYAPTTIEANLLGLSVSDIEISMNMEEDQPVDFWLPYTINGFPFEFRGDLSGNIILWYRAGRGIGVGGNALSSNTLIDFVIGDMPPWWYDLTTPLNMDITFITGKNFEIYYPERDNSIINFTLDPGQSLYVDYNMNTNVIKADGTLSFMNGQIFYFQNDFYITEGSVSLASKDFYGEEKFNLSLDLIAKLSEYDSNGNKVDISLILQDANLSNIQPRFESSPYLSENDILSLLGESLLPAGTFENKMSFASIASLASAATQALTRVGVLSSNKNYSLSSTVRDALNLDIFSLRSSLVENMIVDALPGELSGNSNISLLARYLDGTSLFAGKYIRDNIFAQMTLQLKADRRGFKGSDKGRFLAKDLLLDMEFSLDWDNPLGTFTIFTRPQELSGFDVLDTIGFSVTKRLAF